LDAERSLSVRALRVPPAIVLARASELLRQGSTPAEFTCWDSATELRQALGSETVDLSIAPTNLAAEIYTRGGGYRVLGVAMWGILHVVGRGVAGGWNALAGARVAVPLRGNMPDTIFGALLARRGVKPAPRVDHAASYADAVDAVIAGAVEAAVLPEPYASEAIGRGAQRWLDLQHEWGEAFGGLPRYPQAVTLLHSRRAAQAKPIWAAVDDAVAWIAREPELAAALGAPLLGVSAATITAGLRATYWASVSGPAARPEIERFLTTLAGISPNLYQGPMPDAGFYWALGP
jgi:NitT/TauT family transport system substrate-binding protein